MNTIDIKKFNKRFSELQNKYSRTKAFYETCGEFGLECLRSNKGHLIGTDGDTYGAHVILGRNADYAYRGCWGNMVESGTIRELRLVQYHSDSLTPFFV